MLFNLKNVSDLKAVNIEIVNEDLDNYIKAGVYTFGVNYTPLHAPEGVTNGWLIVLPWNLGATCKQIWLRQGTIDSTDFRTYIRTRILGVWGKWSEIITSSSSDYYSLLLSEKTIPEKANLNNYKTIGIYRATGSGIGETIKNSPTTFNFKLIVESSSSDTFITQTVIGRNGKKWTRAYDTSANEWTDWTTNYINYIVDAYVNTSGKLVVTKPDGKVATFTPTSFS